MGHRMSSLPVVRFCARSAETAAAAGSGRAAAMGSAAHAAFGKQPDAAERMARLTQEERDEIAGWKMPATIVLSQDPMVCLEYVHAHKENTVALRADGTYTYDEAEALTVGHVDMVWIREVNGMRVAYVGDMKKSAFTATEGPRSLQLQAYGLACALKYKCDAYCCGIWVLTDGYWEWGDIVDISNPFGGEWEVTLEEVLAAASHDSEEYSMGPHCSHCYGRSHCPARLLHYVAGESQLEVFAQPGGITRDNAYEALSIYEAAKGVLEKVKTILEDYGEEAGGIEDGKGKVWRKTWSKGGSVSFDKKRFEEEHPELYQQYCFTNNKPRNMGFRWANVPKQKAGA